MAICTYIRDPTAALLCFNLTLATKYFNVSVSVKIGVRMLGTVDEDRAGGKVRQRVLAINVGLGIQLFALTDSCVGTVLR